MKQEFKNKLLRQLEKEIMQKKVLEDTTARIQEHIEGDYIKGGSWMNGETRLLYFPPSPKELPNKYPEMFPDFVQGKRLPRGTDIDKEKEWTPPYRTYQKINAKLRQGYNLLNCTRIGDGKNTEYEIVQYIPKDVA